MAAQAGQAAEAAATAVSTSAALAMATRAAISPEAGSKTSPNVPLRAGDGAAADEVPDFAHGWVPPECLGPGVEQVGVEVQVRGGRVTGREGDYLSGRR